MFMGGYSNNIFKNDTEIGGDDNANCSCECNKTNDWALVLRQAMLLWNFTYKWFNSESQQKYSIDVIPKVEGKYEV